MGEQRRKKQRMEGSKWIRAGAMLLLLCMFATGCGSKVSVMSLFQGANKSAEKIKSVDMDMTFKMECEIEAEDSSMTMGIDMDANIKSEKEKGICIEGEGKVKMLGSDMNLPIKSYTVLDGEDALVYSYDPYEDTWSCEKRDTKDVEDLTKGMAGMDFSQIYENLELQKDPEDYNGRKCYKVTGEFKGSDVEGLIEILGDTLEDDSIDTDSAEYFKADAEFYFDKSSKELAGIRMDFAGSDWEKMMNSPSPNEEDTEESLIAGTKMSMSVFEVELKLNDTNNYKFKLPEDVKKNAQE